MVEVRRAKIWKLLIFIHNILGTDPMVLWHRYISCVVNGTEEVVMNLESIITEISGAVARIVRHI